MSEIEIIYKYINLKKILIERYEMDVYCDKKCMYVNDKATGKSTACSSLEQLQGIINGINLVDEGEDVPGI